MVGRIALRPLLRLLRGALQDKKWAELTVLLKDRLFAKRKPPKNHDPLPPLLFQMATSYWLSQAIYVAAKLGVADLLKARPQSSVELAVATRCDSSSLFRVLRALSSAGVFAQIGADRFALAGLGNSLRSDITGSLRAIVITIGEIHYQACGALIHTVTTGSPAFNRLFGASLFEHLQNDAQDSAAFNKGMTDLSSLLAYAVLLAYDFSEITSIVDVGGGEGELLGRILAVHPEMTGVVFDSSRELRSPQGVKDQDRCSFTSGSFFDFIPEGSEAYLLCGVLHDWDDERAGVILRNCRKAIGKKGRLLIVETVVPETNVASFSKLLDINMMVMTAGRERTKFEFQMLLRGADFRVNRIIPTLAPQSIIEAISI
jgi:hypothetical protein